MDPGMEPRLSCLVLQGFSAPLGVNVQEGAGETRKGRCKEKTPVAHKAPGNLPGAFRGKVVRGGFYPLPLRPLQPVLKIAARNTGFLDLVLVIC